MKLFIDIETIPNLENASEEMMNLYLKKYGAEGEQQSEVFKRAGLYPEFGVIVCISVGAENQHWELITKSYTGNEKTILSDISEALKNHTLIWHNIKGFDIPFITKRMIINNIELPLCLKLNWKKPREITHQDTMEIRKGIGRDNTSLDILCRVLNIESPKQGGDGSQVYLLYQQGKIDEIAKYCEWDVKATYEVYKRLS